MVSLGIPEARERMGLLAKRASSLAKTNGSVPQPETFAAMNQIADVADWLVTHLDVDTAASSDVTGLLTLLRDLHQTYRALWIQSAKPMAESTARTIVPKGTDPSQAWFWDPYWQDREREADEDSASGRTTSYESEEAFEAALAEVDAEQDEPANV